MEFRETDVLRPTDPPAAALVAGWVVWVTGTAGAGIVTGLLLLAVFTGTLH